MISYLELDETERDTVIQIQLDYIETNKSNIVKVFSMQTLANLAEKDDAIKSGVIEKIKETMEKGSPAVVNRGRKPIDRLKK
ncbi:MAG: hypothetical protein ACE5QW_08345 [Thermoplasmata archaeon]